MKRSTWARAILILLVSGVFAATAWHLFATAPKSHREKPALPTPLVDVMASQAGSHAVTVRASGTVISAFELQVRPEVGGRLIELHAAFEPGGRIPAGETLARVDTADYALAVSAAEADVAKAEAAIALEQGRRVVAREELASLRDSLTIDGASQALALRKPQLRQVQAELAAARNRLEQARLDLSRTQLVLPYDVIVLERVRVVGEVVAARELIGRVTRADRYWIDLRVQPIQLARLHARTARSAGSRVTVRFGGQRFDGEVVRIRADVASGSRLGGVIAAVPQHDAGRLLLGSFVEADIDAGHINDVVRIPRRAMRENARVWVVDAQGLLQIRAAEPRWESGQFLLIDAATLQPGDRIVVSRINGLVPGTSVRTREIPVDEHDARLDDVLAPRDDG